jgi:aspartate/methionine/tyrosine aminotransferase
MIGVCNPHNPLGHVLRADEVRTLAEFAARHDLWVMNDEIWSDIVYADDREDVAFHSLHGVASELTQKTVTIYGFSKTFAMAGLRAAFMLCPDRETADRFMQAADMPSTAGGVAPLVQVAATAAFTDAWPWVDAFVAHLQRQRDYAISRLSAMPGIQVTEPEGTYVLFPDITGLSMSSQETVDALHREARVALVPGTPAYFGPGGEGYIRICFATSQGILREGLDRIENWITRREVRAQNRSAPK